MKLVLIPLVWLTLACAGPTQFTGSAHIKGGQPQCVEICKGWNMELVGMVASGEYSDGCICQVRGKQVTLLEAGTALLASSSGVLMQTRAAEEEAAKKAQAQ